MEIEGCKKYDIDGWGELTSPSDENILLGKI